MNRSRIWEILGEVEDPEFLVSIVDMGLIVDAAEREGSVSIKLTFTAMGCPAMDMIIEDAQTRLLNEPGVDDVNIEIVWEPVWTAERLTGDGRLALQELGIAV